ncbi:MAG: hypothetical protein WD896_01250 [Parcubacteria group bacterium]
MDKNQIKKILDQLTDHEGRLQRLEGSKPKSVTKAATVPKKRQGKGEGLHPPIQKLFDSGFFNEARIDLDVVSELQKKLLTRKKPLRASVVNVLRNFVRDGMLERADIVRNEKKLIAYIKT